MSGLRLATAADLPAIADLIVLHSGGDPAQRLASLVTELDRHPATSHLFVATDTGKVAGFGRVQWFDPPADGPPNLTPPGYYLAGLVVGPAYRRRGLGEQLVRVRMAWTAARAPEIWYFTNATNQASLRLHERLGFHEVTRDFTFPGVTFTGGVGVLCRAALTPAADGVRVSPA